MELFCHLVQPEARINSLRFPNRKRETEIRLQWNEMYKLHTIHHMRVLSILSGKKSRSIAHTYRKLFYVERVRSEWILVGNAVGGRCLRFEHKVSTYLKWCVCACVSISIQSIYPRKACGDSSVKKVRVKPLSNLFELISNWDTE